MSLHYDVYLVNLIHSQLLQQMVLISSTQLYDFFSFTYIIGFPFIINQFFSAIDQFHEFSLYEMFLRFTIFQEVIPSVI